MPNTYQEMTEEQLYASIGAVLNVDGWRLDDFGNEEISYSKSFKVGKFDVLASIRLMIEEPEEIATDVIYPIFEATFTLSNSGSFDEDYYVEAFSVVNSATLDNVSVDGKYVYADFAATGDVIRGRTPESMANDMVAYVEALIDEINSDLISVGM